MAAYDDYVWRLKAEAPHVYDVVLPHDLEWIDEFSWKPISQVIKPTLTGGIVIHEYKKQIGRPITLVGADDMAWIQRPLVKEIHTMIQEESIVMTLDFIKASYNQSLDTWVFDVLNILQTHKVMFRHTEDPFQVESVKRYGNFENDSWFKVKSIGFTEVKDNILDPCT